MAVTPDLNQIAVVMSQLQHNYSQLAQNWYDVFFSTEEKDITVTFFDEDGNLITDKIPSRSKDFKYIKNGLVDPTSSSSTVVANIGTIYQDLSGGNAYIKKSGTGSTGWVKLSTTDDIANIVRRGAYDPEGTVTGSKGDLFVNTATGSLYLKTTDNSNTGWISAISSSYADRTYVDTAVATSATTKANVSLDNLTTTAEKHFLNKTQISNCILEAPNGVCTSVTNTITLGDDCIILFPNGRSNTDNSLNNATYTADGTEVYTSEYSTAKSNLHLFASVVPNSNGVATFKVIEDNCIFYKEDSAPISPTVGITAVWFSNSTNMWKITENGGAWTDIVLTEVATFNTDSTGNIAGLNPVEVVSIIKSNDIPYFIGDTPVISLSGTNVDLTDNSVHSIVVNENTTFNLPTIISDNRFHQMLVLVNMATLSTINLNTSKYFYNNVPTMTSTGKYTIIYEYDGTQWTVGVMYKG